MLTEIVGVGRWTVEMILMFTLSRPDVFAIKDGGLVSGVMRLYKLEKYHPKSGHEKAMKQKDFENKIISHVSVKSFLQQNKRIPLQNMWEKTRVPEIDSSEKPR